MKIIDTDNFIEMPITSRLLYFDLCMRADDDGFVSAPKKIMRMTGSSDDDLKILFTKNYIIPFESGVVVIKHWRLHNYIKGDRYSETIYKSEKACLTMDKNTGYELMEPEWIQNGSNLEPEWNQNGSKMDTQVRLGKDRLELGKSSSSLKELELDAAADEQLKEIVKVYEQEIGTMTPIIAEEIELLLEDLPVDLIIRAIQEASIHNVKSWKYISSILNRCLKEGIKTKADFENRRSGKKEKPRKKENSKYEDVYMN